MMALEGIISLFLIISVGVYASKKNIITKEINKGLTDLLLNITLPLLIISSFNLKFSDEIKTNIIICTLYSGITLVVAIIISKLLLKPLKKEDKYININAEKITFRKAKRNKKNKLKRLKTPFLWTSKTINKT